RVQRHQRGVGRFDCLHLRAEAGPGVITARLTNTEMMRLGSPDPAAVRVSAERSAEELLGQVAILAEALERSREENAQLRAALRPPEIMFPLEWRLQPMRRTSWRPSISARG